MMKETRAVLLEQIDGGYVHGKVGSQVIKEKDGEQSFTLGRHMLLQAL